MRKLSYILTFTLNVLLFAACSEDDILQSSPLGETEEAGSVPVTFTATVDYSIEEIGGGAAKAVSTRATADVDDAPIRFYGQAVSTVANTVQSEVIEGTLNAQTGKYEFVFHLTPQATYTYMFWADNADAGAIVPTDLKAVAYTPGNIAFAATASGTPENVATDITVKHVVTKVTISHSGTNTFSPKANDVLAVSLPCATSYNVFTGEATGSNTQSVRHTFEGDASLNTATTICSFYNLATASTNNVTLTFCDKYTLTISNVPLQANSHVILQGDLSLNNSGWSSI